MYLVFLHEYKKYIFFESAYIGSLLFHCFRSGDKKEEAIIDNSRTEEELGSLLVKISNLQVRQHGKKQ